MYDLEGLLCIEMCHLLIRDFLSIRVMDMVGVRYIL